MSTYSATDLPGLLAGKVCLVDGSLVPTFDWRHIRQLYSAKHKKAGVNVLFTGDLHGRLIGCSRAYPGAWHDTHCLDHTGWQTHLAEQPNWIGDSGFQGTTAIYPIKKAPGQTDNQLRAADRHFNTTIARLRAANEWVIAHTKNWRPHHPLPLPPHPHRHRHPSRRRTPKTKRTTLRNPAHLGPRQEGSFRMTP
ncbi:MAG: transposase family protein [Nocardioidaceae bacterium]